MKVAHSIFFTARLLETLDMSEFVNFAQYNKRKRILYCIKKFIYSSNYNLSYIISFLTFRIIILK